MTIPLPAAVTPTQLQRSTAIDFSSDRVTPLPELKPAFGDILAEVRAGGSSAALNTPPRESAEELVAMTLVQPMLAQLRTDVFGGGAFSSGTIQDRLAPFADATIARDMVKGSRMPIVDAVERTMTRNARAIPTTPSSITQELIG